MSPWRPAVAAFLLLACGDDDGPGDTDDGGDQTSADAAGTVPDAAAHRDGAAPASDAGPVPDGAPDVDGGGDVECPRPGAPLDGLTPIWLEGVVPAEPTFSRLIAVDEGPGCSVVVGGYTGGGVVLGQGQPGETQLDEAVWFAARYEVDGALTWVAELSEQTVPFPLELSIVVMADGTTIAMRRVEPSTWQLFRIAPDGVVQGEPVSLEADLVRPWSGGAYVARTSPDDRTLERLSLDGEVEWSRSIGYPQSLVWLPDGRVLHAGTYEFDGIILNRDQPDAFVIDSGDPGCYLALYEPDGSLAWVRTIDNDDRAPGQCGVEAADDWLAVWVRLSSVFDLAAFFPSTGDGERIDAGTWLGMVIRYDLDGTLAWYRGIIPNLEGELIRIERGSLSVGRSADGLVTLGGQMSGIIAFERGGPMGGLTFVTSESNQGWFARYTADGELLGPRTFSSPEPGDSVVNASVTRSDGAAVLVGDFTGTLAFDPLVLTADPGGSFAAEVR